MNANFEFDGKFASDFELMACSFNDIPEAMGGNTLQIDSVKILGTNEFAIPPNGYSEPLTYSFSVCKVRNCEILPMDASEYGRINRWLNRQEPHKFRTSTDSFERIFYMGTFNLSPVFINGYIYGIDLTFTSTFPYGFEDAIENKYTGVTDFEIICFSDEIGDVYPYVEITVNEAGNLTIRNSLDNEIFVFNNVEAGEQLILDNQHKIITTSSEVHTVYDDFNFNFLKLCNTFEERNNVFNSSLNIDITFKYNPIRKVGIC
jgi:hypothetical protein